jgi:hypothetical protein
MENKTMSDKFYVVDEGKLEALRAEIADVVQIIVSHSRIFAESEATVNAWETLVSKMIHCKYICYNEFSEMDADLYKKMFGNIWEGGDDPYP